MNLTLYLAVQAVTYLLAVHLAIAIQDLAAATPLAVAVATVPAWLQWVWAILILDLAAYAGHRLTHYVPPLWRLHAVHHSDQDLDVTTTVRHHPPEIVMNAFILGTAAGVASLSRDQVATYGTLAFAVQLMAHANLSISNYVQRRIGMIFVTPALHAVHHACHPTETNSNFGEMFSVWDQLFGTLRMPHRSRPTFGLDDFTHARTQTLRFVLCQPFVRGQRHRAG